MKKKENTKEKKDWKKFILAIKVDITNIFNKKICQ